MSQQRKWPPGCSGCPGLTFSFAWYPTANGIESSIFVKAMVSIVSPTQKSPSPSGAALFDLHQYGGVVRTHLVRRGLDAPNTCHPEVGNKAHRGDLRKCKTTFSAVCLHRHTAPSASCLGRDPSARVCSLARDDKMRRVIRTLCRGEQCSPVLFAHTL